MAILKSGNDEYEVRIKRYPEKTYFDDTSRPENEKRRQPQRVSDTSWVGTGSDTPSKLP
jgi:hypothetical protein